VTLSTRWLLAVAVVTIALGIVFRVEHIERRLFWQDETYTALRVSGHTDPEFRTIFDSAVHQKSDVDRFQQFDPSLSVAGTVGGLATEEPQHAPLFYVLDHFWASIFGSSIPSLRALALLFGLLAIVTAYFFCIELTGSREAGLVVVSLLAVSPFFVNYAGQAREYTLWAAMISLTSWLLLRAVRLENATAWLLYTLATAVALYSDLLMIFVVAAHVLWVAITYFRERGVLARFAVSVAAAALLFSPWLVVCATHASRIALEQKWGFDPYPLRLMIEKWAFNSASVLFDGEYARTQLMVFAAASLLLIAVAAVYVMRTEKPATRLFLIMLGGVIAVQQIGTDILTHGHESTTARYLVPLWLAALLVVATFLGRRLAVEPSRISTGWFAALLIVLAVAGTSSAMNSSAVVWWDNNDNNPSTTIAADINASGPTPLVVSEGHWAEVLVMSHYLRSGTHFVLFKHTPPLPLPHSLDAFLLTPSARTLADFRTQHEYELVPVPVAPLASSSVLSFHQAVQKAQSVLQNRVTWQQSYLFRLENRVARR